MTTAASARPDDLAANVERSALAALVPAARRSLLMSVVSVIVFSALLWRHNPTGMASWIAVRVGFSAAALALLKTVADSEWAYERQLGAVKAVMGGSGMVWGLIPLFVQPSAPEWRAVVTLWLFGNQSTITALCSPSKPVFRWALGTVTVVGAAAELTAGDSYAVVLAGLLLLGGLFSLMVFAAIHPAMNAAISGHLTTTALAAELEQQQVELRAANRALLELASRDALTQLPNRRTFAAAVADDAGVVTTPTILGFVDLDSFKAINDSRGHAAGDALLQEVADRWQRVLPAGVVLARTGGDEFALHMPGATMDDANELASRLVLALDAPIAVDGGSQVTISCSIGLARAEAGNEFDAVMAQADAALYRVKKRGGGSFGASNRGPTARVGAAPTSPSGGSDRPIEAPERDE